MGYAVGGAFLSLAYFDLPYNILVILVVSMRWLEEKRWNVDTKGALDAEAPTSKVRVATPQRINA